MNLLRLLLVTGVTATAAGAVVAVPPSADDPVPVDPRVLQSAPAPVTSTPNEEPPPLTDEVPRLELPKVEPPGPPPVFVEHQEAEQQPVGSLLPQKKEEKNP